MFPTAQQQTNSWEQLFHAPGQAADQTNAAAPGYAKQTALINMLSALLTIQDLTLEAELAQADVLAQSPTSADAAGPAIGIIAPQLANVNKLQRQLGQYTSLVNNWFVTYSGQPATNIPAPPLLSLFPDLQAFKLAQGS